MARLKRDVERARQEHLNMVRRLRSCSPPASSLGAHLLALTDPATGQPLTDAQLEAELITFFFAGAHPTVNSTHGFLMFSIQKAYQVFGMYLLRPCDKTKPWSVQCTAVVSNADAQLGAELTTSLIAGLLVPARPPPFYQAASHADASRHDDGYLSASHREENGICW